MKKLLFVMAILLVGTVAFAQSGTSGVSPSGQGATNFNGGMVTENWTGIAAGAGPNNLGGPGLGRHDLFNGSTPLGCETCHLPHTAPTYGSQFQWAWKVVPSNVTTYVTETNPSGALISPAGRTGNTRSMLCLTCHDGTSASSNNITSNNVATGAGMPWPLLNTAGGSGSLGSEHPVDALFPNSTEYVQPVYVSGAGSFTASQQDSIAGTVGAQSLPLWLATSAGTTGPAVECASCHDPHNDYQNNATPLQGGVGFLRVANTNGVQLCRECHNK